MSYTNNNFLPHLSNINVIFEVGARDCEDSLDLANNFKNAKIYTYECNPLSIENCKNTASKCDRVYFNSYGLGEKEEIKNFYPYILGNPGASSFYKRIDYDDSQISIGEVKISTLEKEMEKYNINFIDLLCMDVQGYELNVIKGLGDKLSKVHYIILECPKEKLPDDFLPNNIHSKYIGAPTYKEIVSFLDLNGFKIVTTVFENLLEDNILFENLNWKF